MQWYFHLNLSGPPSTFLYCIRGAASSRLSGFFLTLLCCDRFHKGSSLCVLALSVSLLVSVCLPSFSGVTPFWHYCHDSVPICLSLSGFPSISPSFPLPPPWLDVSGMWQKSCEPLDLFLLAVFLSPAEDFFHHSGAGSEKAVHLSIAGAEHHVPVNTRPPAALSHLVSSSRPLFSADSSQILKKKKSLRNFPDGGLDL